MDLKEYCQIKKIDPAAFQVNEPERWNEFSAILNEVHPESLTQQKKFLINELRRKYPVKVEISTTPEVKPVEKAGSKPVIKIPSIKKP